MRKLLIGIAMCTAFFIGSASAGQTAGSPTVESTTQNETQAAAEKSQCQQQSKVDIKAIDGSVATTLQDLCDACCFVSGGKKYCKVGCTCA